MIYPRVFIRFQLTREYSIGTNNGCTSFRELGYRTDAIFNKSLFGYNGSNQTTAYHRPAMDFKTSVVSPSLADRRVRNVFYELCFLSADLKKKTPINKIKRYNTRSLIAVNTSVFGAREKLYSKFKSRFKTRFSFVLGRCDKKFTEHDIRRIRALLVYFRPS